MSNVFDMLTGGGVIGEVTEDGKTYATAPTPPDGDSSTKVATTAFVKTATPSGNVAVWSMDFTANCGRENPYWKVYIYAPTGGTWFVVGGDVTVNTYYDSSSKGTFTVSAAVGKYSGGARINSRNFSNTSAINRVTINNQNALAIKIA